MKVLVVEPMKEPYEKEIGEGLESLQNEVDGPIQAVYPYEDPVAIICNDEGKLTGLELNRALRDEDGRIYDVIAGTFLVAGLTYESFGSLTPELSRKFSELFKQPEMFVNLGGKITAIPVEAQKEPKQETKKYRIDETALLKGAVTNLGKYNEGILDYKWVSFPISDEDLHKVYKEIDIDNVRYEEIFITDYDCEVSGIYDKLGEYTSIRDLNALAERLEGMSSYEIKHFEAVMDAFGASDAAEMINITYNLDCWDFLPDVDNYYDLGYYWIEESGCYDAKSLGSLSNYIDYESFGRDISIEECGQFTDGGYIYANGNSMDQVYDPVYGYDEAFDAVITRNSEEER